MDYVLGRGSEVNMVAIALNIIAQVCYGGCIFIIVFEMLFSIGISKHLTENNDLIKRRYDRIISSAIEIAGFWALGRILELVSDLIPDWF